MAVLEAAMEWPDIVVIVLYFAIITGVGLWASCRAKTNNATGFFLAERTMHWIPIGASTFSTNVGAPMFLGMAGTAAANGLAITMFEWHAMWTLLLLGWIFLPVYISSGCFTMPEYLKLRYGGQRIRVWLAILTTIVTIISQISGQLYAGAVFVQQIFDWNLYLSIILILLVTGAFTILGGLSAVIWTDTIQTIILIGGAFTVTGIALYEIGDFESIRHQFMHSAANYTLLDAALYNNRSCGLPPNNSFHIFRSADDPNFPWPGMVFGLTVMALNAWCCDQICVQRSLSAKNMSHAKAGVVLAAYLKVLSFAFFIIPGMISRVLYPDEIACADPIKCKEICGISSGCYDIAYPLLVLRLLPTGIRGVMMAALLSALVSSMTSIFNSSSTVFTMDLWRRCRPRASEREKMVVSRLWILLLIGVSIAWLPVLQIVKGSQFWTYTQSTWSFFVPPIVMTFLFGIFWPRTTEQGAFWGMIGGFVCGVTRMCLDWSYPAPPCGSHEPDSRFQVIAHVHYLHFSALLALITSVLIVVVSLMTKPRPENKLRRVTWWTRNSKELPDLSDDDESDIEFDTKKSSEKDEQKKVTSVEHYALKWFCGVDLRERKTHVTREERHQLQLKATNISEDPFWKKVVDINGLICCAICFFLHGFLA